MTQAELLKMISDSSNANVYLKDGQGKFLMVNRRVAELFGVSQEEVVGKTDYDFIASEECDMFRKYDRQAAETGKPLTIQVTITIAGARRTFIDHKFPVTDVDGSPNAVGGIAIEITNIDAVEEF